VVTAVKHVPGDGVDVTGHAGMASLAP
jgi:hypothetical protein